jgi:hypothetical protein
MGLSVSTGWRPPAKLPDDLHAPSPGRVEVRREMRGLEDLVGTL